MGKARAHSKRESESSLEEQVPKEPTKASSRGKRIKVPAAPKPDNEPEFFSEERKMEDLWQAVFPIGAEWYRIDSVRQVKWDFSNLENAFEEGGELYGKKAYLFGLTEGQWVRVEGEEKLVYIPSVVAVVSPFPPSDKIAIDSVQLEAKEIVPMKQMKMDWVPYIPLENRDRQVERLKPQVFILNCTQRRVALRHLKLEHAIKYEYCLPYFYQPLQEDDSEQSTIVEMIFPAEPSPEFTDERVGDGSISEDQKDAFKDFVKEKVREAKKANQEAREARKKAREEMSEVAEDAFKNRKVYKFYPVHIPSAPYIPDLRSSFINKFYGKADMVL